MSSEGRLYNLFCLVTKKYYLVFLNNNSFTNPFFVFRNSGIDSGTGAAVLAKGNNSCQFGISVSIWAHQRAAWISIAGSWASLSSTDHTGFDIALEKFIAFFLVKNVNIYGLKCVWWEKSASCCQTPTWKTIIDNW